LKKKRFSPPVWRGGFQREEVVRLFESEKEKRKAVIWGGGGGGGPLSGGKKRDQGKKKRVEKFLSRAKQGSAKVPFPAGGTPKRKNPVWRREKALFSLWRKKSLKGESGFTLPVEGLIYLNEGSSGVLLSFYAEVRGKTYQGEIWEGLSFPDEEGKLKNREKKEKFQGGAAYLFNGRRDSAGKGGRGGRRLGKGGFSLGGLLLLFAKRTKVAGGGFFFFVGKGGLV